MAAEVIDRQAADAAQRELLTRRLTRAESERRKLLDAYYYGGAIDVPTLRTEQARIGTDITAANDRLTDLDANLGEWQEILDLAVSLATRCSDAYTKASDRTRKLFNAAVFERLDVKDGRLSDQEYRPPFDDIFNVPQFEYGTRVDLRSEFSNSGLSARSPVKRFLQVAGKAGHGVELSDVWTLGSLGPTRGDDGGGVRGGEDLDALEALVEK